MGSLLPVFHFIFKADNTVQLEACVLGLSPSPAIARPLCWIGTSLNISMLSPLLNRNTNILQEGDEELKLCVEYVCILLYSSAQSLIHSEVLKNCT